MFTSLHVDRLGGAGWACGDRRTSMWSRTYPTVSLFLSALSIGDAQNVTGLFSVVPYPICQAHKQVECHICPVSSCAAVTCSLVETKAPVSLML